MQKSANFRRKRSSLLDTLSTKKASSLAQRKQSQFQDMDTPQNVSDVRRFLGMVNKLGKFVPHLAEKTKPLRDLLSTKNEFLWGPTLQDAFEKLKKEVTSTPVLAHYDPARKKKLKRSTYDDLGLREI